MILAATGHRPNKLGGYTADVDEKLYYLALDYLTSRPEMITGGLTIISGMALGWDTAWARAGLDLKIPVIAAVPFIGQEKQWPFLSQDRYRKLMKQINMIMIVCEGGYAPEKMQERNEWMVDECDELIAL